MSNRFRGIVALVSLALAACGPTSHATEARSSDEAREPAAPSAPMPVEEHSEEARAELLEEAREQDEADEDVLIVRIEDAPGATPDTFLFDDEHDYDLVLVMRLGARLVRVRVEGFQFTHQQSGNGEVFDIEFATVPGGVMVVAHHNLDQSVDPPRFSRSRWSEGWWFPADMRSGERAAPVLGEHPRVREWVQFAHAVGQPDGSVCVSDALGTAHRYEVHGRALERAERPEPCARIVAEQPEHVFVHERGGWEIEGDDYLAIAHTETLSPRLTVAQVAWSDGGQDDGLREARSTRLVSEDAEGQVHWYYLSIGAWCTARMVGQLITCGTNRFQFDTAGLIAIDPSSSR